MTTPVDVLIIGAGASGAAVAWSLAETKMHILCLEQGDWTKPSEYPSTARDWEARQLNDFHSVLRSVVEMANRRARGERDKVCFQAGESPSPATNLSPTNSHREQEMGMKKIGVAILCCVLGSAAYAQSIVGTWSMQV